MMTHTCNPSTCEVEVGGSGVQSQPWIHETLSMNKGREGQRKKEKKEKKQHQSILLHMFLRYMCSDSRVKNLGIMQRRLVF